jgi:O-antigen/teichoic acid export membrane protein
VRFRASKSVKAAVANLIRGEGFRNAFALGAGTAIGQAAVVLASPVWSRIYLPADFGRYGLIVSFLATASVAVSLRYEIAIPLARDQVEAVRLVLLSLLCTLPVSLAAGGVFLILTSQNLLGFGSIVSWSTFFVVISLVMTGAFSTIRYWHVRNGNFKEISVSLVAQGLGRSISPIVLSSLNWGWLGLFSGELVGRSLGIRNLSRSLMPLLRSVARQTSISEMRGVWRSYRQYPLVFLPSSILDAASAALPIPVFVGLYGISAGGELLLAQQIVLAPAGLICGSLGDVFHSKLVPGGGVASSDLPKLVCRTAAKLLLLAVVVYVPLACLAPFLSVPIFGASWARAGEFVAILSPATIVMIAVNPITRAMFVSRIPQIKLMADVVKLVLPMVGLIGGSKMRGASMATSIACYSLMLGVSYAIYFAIVLLSVRVSNQLPTVQQNTNVIVPSDSQTR